jgi:hypothetical protein
VIERRRISPAAFLCSLLGIIALVACAGAAPAHAEAPRWDILARSAPTNLSPGGSGEIVAVLINLGDAPVVATEGDPVEITDELPPGLKATKIEGLVSRGDNDLGTFEEPKGSSLLQNCTTLPALRCPYVGTLPPFIAIEVRIRVEVSDDAPVEAHEENEVKVEGAETPPKSARRPIAFCAEPPFCPEHSELSPEEEDGSPAVQAGSHPFQLTTTIALNQTYTLDPQNVPFEKLEKKIPRDYPSAPAPLRNLDTTLPPGLLADTRASVFPQCSAVEFATLRAGNSNLCPAGTAVGAAVVTFKEPIHFAQATATVPVFNLVPEVGEPARFGFVFEGVPVVLDTSLQTGKGYAAEVKVENSSEAAELLSSVVTIWGVPGASQHDSARGWECLGGGDYLEKIDPRPPCPSASSNPPPYLILPTTRCGAPLATSVTVESWQAAATPMSKEGESESLQGCERLQFEPAIAAQPDQREASTPTGLNIEVSVPQNTTLSSSGLAEADIEDTTVALPEGMQANPGAAGGLAVCSTAGVGFNGFQETEQLENDHFDAAAASCPDASKVGTVTIKTPLLENELTGYVYFAEQNTNPFASPLVLYVIAEDPVSGTRVKLAGEVKIDPATGQLTSVFRNTPPLPFETLELHLFPGERASQTTPSLCRANETTATFEPTSGEAPVQRSSSFTTEPNADGQPCPASGPLPFAPSFQAGSTNSQAGGFSPFTLTIGVPDGDAALKTVSMQLPPGLAAVLASVTPCPEPQAAEGTCGEESLVGHSTVSSGLGRDPVTLPGSVYLTGPYDGAPFGLSAVTPAVAGPFHLGRVVARSSISINPNTAAATIDTEASKFFALKSEQGEQTEFAGLPQFVKGTATHIKQLNVTIERPGGFQFNPTNCAPTAITGTLTGYEGASESVSYPFEATNCASLPFKPELTASVAGHGSKADGTTFAVKIKSPGLGQANIRKVDLTIPAALPSRLSTLQKACPETVFDANPAACGEGSVIGEGIVRTPVFKSPLSGPAYLVSHGGAAFPDVEFVLQGEGVTIVLDGKTDIKDGITYSKFETAPDAPFTTFETIFPAGPHSALTANVPEREDFSLCRTSLALPTEITGQNGAFVSQTTKVAVIGCGAVKSYKVTKAQRLAKALKACKKDKRKRKRLACEKAARKNFATKAKKSGGGSARKSASGSATKK